MSGSHDDFDSMSTGFTEPISDSGRAGDFDSMSTGFQEPVSQASAPVHDLQTGFLLDERLSVIRQLGKGGMGTVYEVIDVRTQAKYAVKVLNAEISQDENMLRMLAQEVASAQNVTHQNLLKVNWFSDSGPVKYLVMEYLEGNDLMDYMARKGGGLSFDETIKLAKQVAAGLDYLHDRGLVHLDVKPHNVFVTHTGEVRILDFGIAKAVKSHDKQEGSAGGVGTLAYMAPEQRSGGGVDRRSDIYAFGLMVSQMLSGKLPFDHRSKEAVLAWHDSPAHRLHNVGDESQRAAIQDAVAFDPSGRPRSCGAVIDALDASAKPAPAPSVAPAPAPAAPSVDRYAEVRLNPEADERSPKSWAVLMFCSVFLGLYGVDHWYLGNGGKGLLKMFTFSGMGIWWWIDVINTLRETRTDSDGLVVKR